MELSRPAFMKPTKGAKNVKRFYKIIDLLFPFFRFLNKTYFLTLAEVSKAMINVSLIGYKKNIIEVKDISELSKR
jgi:hypothetical protein